jgi:hypothetical protein
MVSILHNADSQLWASWVRGKELQGGSEIGEKFQQGKAGEEFQEGRKNLNPFSKRIIPILAANRTGKVTFISYPYG